MADIKTAAELADKIIAIVNESENKGSQWTLESLRNLLYSEKSNVNKVRAGLMAYRWLIANHQSLSRQYLDGLFNQLFKIININQVDDHAKKVWYNETTLEERYILTTPSISVGDLEALRHEEKEL
jgi:hypothetical protein